MYVLIVNPATVCHSLPQFATVCHTCGNKHPHTARERRLRMITAHTPPIGTGSSATSEGARPRDSALLSATHDDTTLRTYRTPHCRPCFHCSYPVSPTNKRSTIARFFQPRLLSLFSKSAPRRRGLRSWFKMSWQMSRHDVTFLLIPRFPGKCRDMSSTLLRPKSRQMSKRLSRQLCQACRGKHWQCNVTVYVCIE